MRFSADPSQPANSGGLLSLITGDVGSQLSSELPSQQQVVTSYLEAVVAFWVIGGITLYAVNKLTK